MKFIKGKKEDILKKLVDSVSLCDRDCDGWSESFSHFRKNGLYIMFSVGPVDRGPRTDHGGGDDGNDWMDDDQLTDLEEEYYKKNKSKLNRLKSLLEEEFSEYEATFAEPTIDYGEKGHIMLELNITIKGRFFNWNGEKIWADYSGAYDKERIMLKTPDIERYFESEEEIVSFLKTFEPKNNKKHF